MKEEKVLYSGIDELAEEFEVYFNECLSGKAPVAFITRQKWRPNIDFYETKQEYCLMVELAGLRKNDVFAEFKDGCLRIHGKRDNLITREKVDYQRMEINAGPFERKVKFRTPVDPKSIDARFGSGILKVKLFKAPKQKSGLFDVPITSM
jgi:HSP20 family molecular chaperone IbpA